MGGGSGDGATRVELSRGTGRGGDTSGPSRGTAWPWGGHGGEETHQEGHAGTQILFNTSPQRVTLRRCFPSVSSPPPQLKVIITSLLAPRGCQGR